MSGYDPTVAAANGGGAPKAAPRRRFRAPGKHGAKARERNRRRVRAARPHGQSYTRSRITRSLSLFAQTSDGVMAIGPDSRILMWNRAAETLLGYTASETYGRRCYDVIRGSDAHGNVFCHAHCPVLVMTRRRELPYAYDVIASAKGGVSRRLNVSTTVLTTRDGPVVVHLFRDVSAHRPEDRPAESRRQYQTAASFEVDENTATTRLTRREREILQLMAQGRSTNAIAQQLVITRATARSHIQNILTKLGVHSRLEAVVQALRPPWAATARDGT